jgi:N-acetylneuraminic acid mutarotase
VDAEICAISGRTTTVLSAWANTDIVEEYDPATDTRNPTKAPPTQRGGISGGVYNGRIYVAGGEFEDARMFASIRAVEAYEPATDQWSVLPPMPRSRHGLAGAVLGDTLHVVGGEYASGSPGDSNDPDALRLSDYK